MKSMETKFDLITSWEHDGTVAAQYSGDPPHVFVGSPPWVGGIQDQTAPSAPWLKSNLTPSAWWQQVRPPSAKSLSEECADRLAAYQRQEARIRTSWIEMVNKKLFSVGLLDAFQQAKNQKDRGTMLRLLQQAQYPLEESERFLEILPAINVPK